MGTATQALNAPLHFLRRKHFIPLRGQQLSMACNRFYRPYETFHPPMGTATSSTAFSVSMVLKHFIPLWGQQLLGVVLRFDPRGETFRTPMGTATGWRKRYRNQSRETFHTPMGTKRKPICPIGHIGFYFIRSCYSHITPPIPSAVLMPTPAYGAKCSSRFAIVR